MDLRIPTGTFFVLLGLILIATSFVVQSAPPLALVNVNLYGGLAMLIFGSAMLWLAKQRS